MKKLSKTLAMLLVVAMMASLVCIPGLADEDPYASLKEGTGYVAIGDSFARGYGASDNWMYQVERNNNHGSMNNPVYGNYECRNVTGSYPNLVAEHFGLDAPDDIRDKSAKFWSIAHNAEFTDQVNSLIGITDNFRGDELPEFYGDLYDRYEADLAYFADEESFLLDGNRAGKDGEVMSIRDMIKDASLISIGLGQSDIIYRSQTFGLNPLMANLDLSDLASAAKGVADLIAMLYSYYDEWTVSYTQLLDYVKANSDAKVALVGFMNPIQNATLPIASEDPSAEVILPIGNAINVIFDLMNKYVMECAENYGYMFIDISNVECPATEKDMTLTEILGETDSIKSALNVHPTPAGYAQIARLIIGAVDEELAKDAAAEQGVPYIPETPNTFIKVDLGRFEKVNKVIVDGNNVSNYDLDTYVLTIPCYVTTANTLAVEVENEDGSITLVTYSLSYEKGEGYTAHRTYETNDAGNVATKMVTTIASIAKTVVTKAVSAIKSVFGGLFKK